MNLRSSSCAFALTLGLAFVGCVEKKTAQPSSSSGGTSTSGSSGSAGTPGPVPSVVSPTEAGVDALTGTVRYLALGDSITSGGGSPNPETVSFVARLSERWRARGCTVELKNVGVSGATSADIIAVQVPELAPFKPTFVTLQVGANDIVHDVTVDTYRANVRTIIDAAKATGARVVVIGQNEWPRSPRAPDYGTNLVEKRLVYEAAFVEEVRAKSVQMVDLASIYRAAADAGQWASDGIHPTPEAYDAVAAEMARVLTAPCAK